MTWLLPGAFVVTVGSALAAAGLLLAALALIGLVAVVWLLVRAWATEVPQVARVPAKAAAAAPPALSRQDRVVAVTRLASSLPDHLLADPREVHRAASSSPRASSDLGMVVAAVSEGVGR